MKLSQTIKTKMQHQSVFTSKASLAEARMLYKTYSKSMTLAKCKAGSYRLANENGYITFSPKESYVHIYVRKFEK